MAKPLDNNVFPFYGEKQKNSTGLRRLVHRLSPFPLHVLYPVAFEAKLFVTRIKGRRARHRYKGQRNLKVNIGPGLDGTKGWVNVDIFSNENVDLVFDCRKELPFDDASVSAIFTEHVFEHIDYTEEVPLFLAECHRVLEPGGVLRIIVPDAGRYLEAYAAGGWEPLRTIRNLGPDLVDPHNGSRYVTRMELINVIFRQGFEHKFAYDYETLEYLLTRTGFSSVLHQSCGVSIHEEVAIDKPERATESLYVEGVK